MVDRLSTGQIWSAIEKELFAVMGWVTAKHEARTAGVVYVVRNRRLYITTGQDSWKVRHMERNPHVSLTVPVHKRIPFMPWIRIPAATISFSAVVRIRSTDEGDPEVIEALVRGMTDKARLLAESCLLEITPAGEFVTYGIGVTLNDMRKPERAGGRAVSRQPRQRAIQWRRTKFASRRWWSFARCGGTGTGEK